jgi:hypothetical protein
LTVVAIEEVIFRRLDIDGQTLPSIEYPIQYDRRLDRLKDISCPEEPITTINHP